jgi:hypothetical protein
MAVIALYNLTQKGRIFACFRQTYMQLAEIVNDMRFFIVTVCKHIVTMRKDIVTLRRDKVTLRNHIITLP